MHYQHHRGRRAATLKGADTLARYIVLLSQSALRQTGLVSGVRGSAHSSVWVGCHEPYVFPPTPPFRALKRTRQGPVGDGPFPYPRGENNGPPHAPAPAGRAPRPAPPTPSMQLTSIQTQHNSQPPIVLLPSHNALNAGACLQAAPPLQQSAVSPPARRAESATARNGQATQQAARCAACCYCSLLSAVVLPPAAAALCAASRPHSRAVGGLLRWLLSTPRGALEAAHHPNPFGLERDRIQPRGVMRRTVRST